jgi:integrase/recombinase XerC
MSRGAPGEHLANGRIERFSGRFRLSPGLKAPGRAPLASAVEVVSADWDRQVAAGGIKSTTIALYLTHIWIFVAYALRQGVEELGDVDSRLISKWLVAPSVGATGVAPATTQRIRLAALKALFTTCLTTGLHNVDPTAGLRLPPRDPRYVRALTDGQDAQCRMTAPLRLGETRTQAMYALAREGASLRENAACLVRDIRLDLGLIWLHDGGARSFNRWVEIRDDWSYRALADRIEYLTATTRPESLDGTRLTYSPRSPASEAGRDASKDQAAREASAISRGLSQLMQTARVLTRGVTRPESIREWTAAKVWDETQSLEAVAYRLGMSSLDDAAHILGRNFQSELRPHNAPYPPGSRPPTDDPTAAHDPGRTP